MTESEYWVYKADLESDQARVVARYGDEEVAVDWASEEFGEEVFVVEDMGSLPRPMNDNVFIVEVLHGDRDE